MLLNEHYDNIVVIEYVFGFGVIVINAHDMLKLNRISFVELLVLIVV